MQITDVRIRKITSEGKMKAIVSVTFNNEFVVHDIKIIEGQNGLFIAMPSTSREVENEDGEMVTVHRDTVHPINPEVRAMFEEAILKAYNEAE